MSALRSVLTPSWFYLRLAVAPLVLESYTRSSSVYLSTRTTDPLSLKVGSSHRRASFFACCLSPVGLFVVRDRSHGQGRYLSTMILISDMSIHMDRATASIWDVY